MSVKAALDRLVAGHGTIGSSWPDLLRAGRDPVEVRREFENLGQRPSDETVDLYSYADGTNPGDSWMFPVWDWPPLRGTISGQPWGAIDYYEVFLSTNLSGVEVWRSDLFPFVFAARGGYCVRLGTTDVSEVWYADVDTGDTPRLIAPSLEGFLQSIADRFENGTYQLVEGYVEEV